MIAPAAAPALAPSAPVAVGPLMREVMEAAADVAPTPTTVLLLGESGTGKELVARFLHERSERPGPWVAVNCAALPGELLESELFGHERGAFTGATERRAGRFEQAHRGTLLLDEISELPLPLQAKLLRVLQEREVDRVGGHRPLPVDVRVLASSNRDLAEMVRRGLFRSDLYYRLNVFPIVLPPLRERREDLPALAAALLADAARALGRPVPALDAGALAALGAHPFPGNVRELRNLLERALVRARGAVLTAGDLRMGAVAVAANAISSSSPTPYSSPIADEVVHPEPFDFGLASVRPERSEAESKGEAHAQDGLRDAAASRSRRAYPSDLPLDLAALERLAIEEALRRVGGNRTHAARLLGIGLRTLRNKLRTWRLSGAEVEPADPAGRPVSPAVDVRAGAIPRAAPQARASQEESP
ncbi:MAG TPA: sigma-54 dependent transcriptional regulator [Anaeromyxobacteraceae bacterium]|nr:sigma-54 dependent transcriptional regulator [Anaeromyxobacteraceae bacterium]